MQFVLTGFTQDLGCRVFAFDGIAVDRIRTAFTVRADMALIRRYGIQIQELPLLCRSVRAMVVELARRLPGPRWNAGAAAFSAERPRP
jgi:hypothetical protein